MSIECELRVDGIPLGAVGLPYTDLAWTDRADGGNFEATWSMSLLYGERPTPLFKGAKVEIMLGASRRWFGELAVVDWAGGSFTATGKSQRAYDFGARDSGGQTSSIPDQVIDTSIAFDGWGILRTASFSGAAVVAGSVTEDQNTVGAILDQSAESTGRRWGVWADGVIRAYVPGTQPYDYILAPGVIELGETTEDTFTRVLARYVDSGTTARATVGAASLDPHVAHLLEDLTNLGPISAAVATAIAQNLINLGASTSGWTNGTEVTSAQLLTAGGLPCELAAVTAGQVVRASVVGDYGQGFRDLVIGETKYNANADTLSLAPTSTTAASLSDVVEDLYTRITGLPVSA